MRRVALVLALAAGLGLSSGAEATGGATPYDDCFNRAGAAYGISPLLLKAIARQESSMRPRAIGRNPNPAMADEYGIGLMQISSWWLPKLRSIGVSESDLLDSPCKNIAIGTWILADNIRRYGMTWNAVGAYNAKTQWKRDVYAQKIQRHLLNEIRAAGMELEG